MNTSLVCIDVYTVCAGDTLRSVAGKYDLPVSLLMEANGLDDPCELQAGMRLCIPGSADRLPAAEESCAAAPEFSAAPTNRAAAPEKSFLTHTVVSGDTLYLIARKHCIKLEDLMRANPCVDPYNLLIGSKLRIPK